MMDDGHSYVVRNRSARLGIETTGERERIWTGVLGFFGGLSGCIVIPLSKHVVGVCAMFPFESCLMRGFMRLGSNTLIRVFSNVRVSESPSERQHAERVNSFSVTLL